MAVTTRTGLIEYCLRALGAPVVEVNVETQQIEDRVDEAIEYFRQYHFDGVEKMYLKHVITQQNIDDKFIEVPDLIYGITKVFPVASGTSTSKSIFDLQYQLRLNDLYDLTSTSVMYYTQVMSHLSLLDMTLNGHPLYRFNRLSNKLYIDTVWQEKMEVGNYILVECYRALDPADAPRLYGDQWLKHYLTALLKKQWAINLKKFSGMQLPGGVSIDGPALYSEAVDEIKNLEEDIMNKSAPLDWFMG